MEEEVMRLLEGCNIFGFFKQRFVISIGRGIILYQLKIHSKLLHAYYDMVPRWPPLLPKKKNKLYMRTKVEDLRYEFKNIYVSVNFFMFIRNELLMII